MTISHRALPVLAAIAIGSGCADLALEPDQIPHSLMISPADARVTVGDVGKLTVTVFDEEGQVIPGPPSWAPPDWQVSDPAKIDFATDGSFAALANGDVRIGAGLAGLRDRTGVLISPSRVVLSAPAVYVNQVVQNLDGSVPLIAGRDALLRVFVTGDQVSYYEPRAYGDFVQDGAVVHTAAMGPPHLIPDAVSERWLIESFNAVIPGDVIQPGVKLSVELDPDGVVPLGPGSQLRVPAEGALALNVTVLPAHRQTIVPVLAVTDTDEQILNWTRGMTAASPHLGFARSVLPIGEMELTVHEPVHTTADLVTNTGWLQLIREMAVIRAMEGRSGYYYGAVVPPRNSAWGGLGYIGFPVSVGRNQDVTFAHELGHNLSLRHAPCGGAGGPDPAFPYDGGSTGVWGYNPQTGGLVDPVVYKDLMGYCSPDWISDYSFVKALNYRVETEISGARQQGPIEADRRKRCSCGEARGTGSFCSSRLSWCRPRLCSRRAAGPIGWRDSAPAAGFTSPSTSLQRRWSSAVVTSSLPSPSTGIGTGHWSAWSCRDPRANSSWVRRAPAPWRSSPTATTGRCARFCGTGAAASHAWKATRRFRSATACPQVCDRRPGGREAIRRGMRRDAPDDMVSACGTPRVSHREGRSAGAIRRS